MSCLREGPVCVCSVTYDGAGHAVFRSVAAPPADVEVVEVVVVIGGAEGCESLAGSRLAVAKDRAVEPLQARVRNRSPNLKPF